MTPHDDLEPDSQDRYPGQAYRHLLSSLALLGILLLGTAAQAAPSLSAYQRHKAERLLQEQWSCLGCHRFGASGGRIAPDLLQLKYRLTAQQLRAVILDPKALRPHTIMPRVRLREEHLDLLVAYLSQHEQPRGAQAATVVPAGPETPGRSKADPQDDSPQGLFRHYCSACHGASGRGDGLNATALTPPPSNLADAQAIARRSDDTLFDIIAVGGRVFGLSQHMPAWGDTLSPGEIRALVSHIRALCQCQGPRWSRDGASR